MKNKYPLQRLNICVLLPEYALDFKGLARSLFVDVYARYLPLSGHNVACILPTMEKNEEYTHEGAHVYPVTPLRLPFLLGKIFCRIYLNYQKMKTINKLFREEGYHLVQVGQDDIISCLLALHIKSKYRVPLVFKVDNLFHKEWHPDLVKHKYRSLQVIVIKISNLILRRLLVKSDMILAVSKSMQETLRKKGISESKIVILPRGANIELFSPNKDVESVRQKYNLGSSALVIYQGTMAEVRQLDVLIRAFARVTERKRNVKLLMVGNGYTAHLKQLTSTLGLSENIIFTGQVPYPEVPQLIAAADIAVCPVPPLEIYKISSPTKLFEYMAMIKPVIANEEIPEHKEVIEQSGGGILVPFDAEAFAQAILELLDNHKQVVEMGRKGREWVIKNRSYRVLARELEESFYQLIHKVAGDRN
ncbi:glycosyltransferase family 4 protein [Chloroflexota bacterium]